MSMWVFLKVFADACLCFGILTSFPAVFPVSISLLRPALLCAAGAGIAAHFRNVGKESLRFLGLLLCAVTLWLPGNRTELVVLLPVVLYSAVVIVRGELSLEYYTFRQHFKGTLIFWVCAFLILCALAYLDKPFDGVENYDAETVIRYGVVYAVAGVALLRQLRLGEQGKTGRRMNATQTAIALGGTGIAVLAVAAAEKWLHQSLMTLLRTAFTALFAPLLMLYNWFAGRGTDVLEGLTGKDPITPQQRPTTPPGAIPMESVPLETPVPEEPEETIPWLVIAVLVILVTVMIVMLRSFRSRVSAPAQEEKIEKLHPQSRPKRDRSTNRSRIRKVYRDFLKAQRKQGMKLRPYHTSADVQQNLAQTTDAAAAAQLRKIYLSARYDEGGEITANQLATAKAAYKKTSRQ